MTVLHREVERTYAAADDATLPSLAALVAGADGALPDPGTPATESGGTLHLAATYFDTADLRLAAAGLTLRRRTGGHDAGWHLKVPAGPDARTEVRFPLGRAVRTVPAPLRALVRARAGGAVLRPVAEVTTERHEHRLVDASGRVLLELADDRVTARRVLPAGGSGDALGAVQSWREVEAEVVDGPEELLDVVDRALRAAGLRPADVQSKLARVLGTGLGEPRDEPARLRRSSPAGEVLRAYLAGQVEQVLAQDLAVRLGTPDAVHQMRVATRRLRSALRTFAPLLDTTVTGPLRDELRWLARDLGTVRDAEVLRDRVRAAAVAAGPLVDAGPDELEDDRRAAHDRVLAELDGERYHHLVVALAALAASPPLRARAAAPARTTLPRLVARRDPRARRLLKRARRAPAGPERDRVLHEARKAAKAARYAGEAVRPALGKQAAAYARALEAVQEVLGEHQDAVITRERLRELARRTASTEAAFRYGRLHALEEERAEQAQQRIRPTWKAARGAGLRRWLR
ncbi:CYTH and CHAD domain-containing protein [Cellulomonas endometrii]|uniref:CYTH and CHAD domain-containing protein n=1 Tax=Cellulomonas endometrii TaxID=3036301 RepID=UPI0024AD8DD5|nr:CYTH and CHAD domain-containing protein [Cellulomonas endometrii]